jgi:ATP-dependent DNA helicase RecG
MNSSEALLILRKVVALELRLGCKDSAVVGGFSRFARDRVAELENLPGVDQAQQLSFLNFLGGYRHLAPHARGSRLEELLAWIKDPTQSGKVPSNQRGKASDPAPTPPVPSPQDSPPSRRPARPSPKPRPSSRQDNPLQYVKGVGPRRASQLKRLGLESFRDLLFHVPLRYEDRRFPVRIRQAKAGEEVTLVARVRSGSAVTGRSPRASRFQAVLEDESGTIEAVWFGQAYLAKALPPGTRAIFFGKVNNRRGVAQLASADFEVLPEREEPSLGLVPVYPLTDGLYQKVLRNLVARALEACADREPDALPPLMRERLDFPPMAKALRMLHTPEQMKDVEQARRRLAFEELLVLQVALALKQRQQQEPDPRTALIPKNRLPQRFRESLPFPLTTAQARALEEISKDLARPLPMSRLLQGDVGSGKTVVAIEAMLTAIDAGQQAALMAPTEILAEQHALTLGKLLTPLGIQPEVLLGGMRKSARQDLLERLEAGEVPLLLGTHALLEKDVHFPHLGLIVIDEQHRFGVGQRARLLQKMGDHPNILVMTATPIPRTLSLTLYGDLDCTVLDELPPGRQPVKTESKRSRSLEKIWQRLNKEIDRGAQAYVVCPLVEESEKMEAQAATDLAEELRQGPFASRQVGLLHGRMKKDEKEAVMTAFREGQIQVLVATTVIEVGVDVPNASEMVILNAERFGLSQLHQLRGRVGRGRRASRCTLVSDFAGEEVRKRLRVMVATNDGFQVAEEDLALRGPGEYFGTRQSGLPELRFADLSQDTRLLDQARQEARELLTTDPDLQAPELAVLAHRVRSKFSFFLEGRH